MHDAGSVRVLIVEDEFLIRMTLGDVLRDEGFAVTEAAGADEALTALRTDPSIALMMTDFALGGGMDGARLAEMARHDHPALPVLYMTARPDLLAPRPDLRERVIGKPYFPADICAMAREMLRMPKIPAR